MNTKELGWPAIMAMLTALVTAAFLATTRLELMLFSFPLSLFGLLSLGLAIWQTRRWWLLCFAPILMAPLGMLLVVSFECARGNCL